MYEDKVTKMFRAYGTFMKFKDQYTDALIMIRFDDNYLLFEEDADNVTKCLGIPMTSPHGGNARHTMFKNYKLDEYLPRLIRSGYRVAICDYYSK